MDFCEVAPDYGCEPLLVGFTLGRETSSPFMQEALRRKIKVLSIRHHFKYDPTPLIQFSSILKQHKVNIIQTHGHKANFIVFILSRFISKPWISFVHGWTDEDWKIRAYNRVDKLLLKFPDRLVTVSKEMAFKLYSSGISRDKVKIINNAVSEKGIPKENPPLEVRDALKIPEEDRLLGVIGRLSSEKGQIHFLQAFSEVIKTFPQVTALIVGEGPDEKKLKEFCISKKIHPKVIFTGYQKDITSIYKSLDLVILPSLSEGMPNVALESMLLGTPVIGTKVGGIPEVITDQKTGMLIPPEDTASLTRTILELLNNKSKMTVLSENAKRFMQENFSLEKRVKSIIELYQETLSEYESEN